MSTTREAAKGNWRMILLHFGLDEKFLRNIHGPCPLCGGEDRYRWDDTDGNGGYYCSQCGPGTGLKLVMGLNDWLFDEACKRIDAFLGNRFQGKGKAQTPAKPDKRETLIRLWRGSREVVKGDPVWKYLERRCGDPADYLSQIRFHPGLKHPMDKEPHPGMVALLQPNKGRAMGVHRTFLTLDGQKAPLNPVRMVFGECAPVQICAAAERMGVGEGIETCICASKQFGIPVWSALNANGLKAWEPPEIAKSIVIFGDNDSNFTGQDAAFSLARKLALKGLHVDVQIPEEPDTDWADIAMGRVA